MIARSREHNPIGIESTAVETSVLEMLEQHGAKTLDQLERELIHIGSAQLLFAIDRLSRIGKIAIGPPRQGDYLVWLLPELPAGTRHFAHALRNIEV
ncbi:MAG: hypothetical protein QM706_04330 [Nitrospira sp.]